MALSAVVCAPSPSLATPGTPGDSPRPSPVVNHTPADLASAVDAVVITAHDRAARGDHADAAELLRRALAASPSAPLFFLSATVELALTRTDRAQADLERLATFPVEPTLEPRVSTFRALTTALAPVVAAARSATLSQRHDAALERWLVAVDLVSAATLVPVTRYLVESGRAAERAQRFSVAHGLFVRALAVDHVGSLSAAERADAQDAELRLKRLVSSSSTSSTATPRDTSASSFSPPSEPSVVASSDSSLAPWLLAGGALFATGGGVAMLWLASEQRDEVRQAIGDGDTGVGLTRKEAIDLESSANTWSVLGYSSLGLALGLGVAATVLAFDEPATHTTIDTATSTRPLMIALDLGPDHARLITGGRF